MVKIEINRGERYGSERSAHVSLCDRSVEIILRDDKIILKNLSFDEDSLVIMERVLAKIRGYFSTPSNMAKLKHVTRQTRNRYTMVSTPTGNLSFGTYNEQDETPDSIREPIRASDVARNVIMDEADEVRWEEFNPAVEPPLDTYPQDTLTYNYGDVVRASTTITNHVDNEMNTLSVGSTTNL